MGLEKARVMRCLVGLLLLSAAVYVASMPLEDPMEMADDMLKHLDMDNAEEHNDQSDLGEGDDLVRQAPVGQTPKNNKMPNTHSVFAKRSNKKNMTGCKDKINPETCKHKKMLCDDKVHSKAVRLQCALTCGVCSRKVSTRARPADKTSFCMVYKKHCAKNKTVQRRCPKTCGIAVNKEGKGITASDEE